MNCALVTPKPEDIEQHGYVMRGDRLIDWQVLWSYEGQPYWKVHYSDDSVLSTDSLGMFKATGLDPGRNTRAAVEVLMDLWIGGRRGGTIVEKAGFHYRGRAIRRMFKKSGGTILCQKK